MQFQTKLFILALLSFLFCFSGCSQEIEIEIIKGDIVNKNYTYNDKGFVISPYGKINIKTHSFYIDNKLTKLKKNTANGFIEYSLNELRDDQNFIKMLGIDTLYHKTKKFEDKVIHKDTTYFKISTKEVHIHIAK